MKITVLQEHLLQALVSAGRVVSQKTQLPVLQNALLYTHGAKFYIAATNTETTIVSFVKARVDKEGGVCVPAKLLGELVVSLSKEPVILETDGDKLTVSCGGTHAEVPGTPKEEFPPVPSFSSGQAEELDKDVFVRAASSMVFAAATDEGRPVLTGVKIIKKGEDTVFVATDGYRLSLKLVGKIFKKQTDINLPARTIKEVVHAAQEDKDGKEITIRTIDEGQLEFVIGDITIYARVIAGEYPNYEKIIPKTHTTRATIDKENFLRAVKSASIFAKDNANIVRVNIQNEKITVSANTPQVGENKVEIDAETEGEDAEIAFNSRFLLEFLNNFPDDSLAFEMTGSLNPGVFKPVNDDSFLHIIMPVRVQG